MSGLRINSTSYIYIVCGTLLPTNSIIIHSCTHLYEFLEKKFLSKQQLNQSLFLCFQETGSFTLKPKYTQSPFMDWQWERMTSADLLQNCDLPPPLKLFSPLNKEEKKSTNPKITRLDVEEPNHQTENISLLRALQLSQSRAREAERRAAVASTNNEQMAAVLLEESMRLSAHKQWLRLLEMEILVIQKTKKQRPECKEDDNWEDGDDAVPTLTWCLTLAICLGIGFALGQYMF